MELDFNEAAERGWEIVPVFQAVKGGQVIKGTMAHVLERISEAESRHELIAEQHRERSRQETHAPITRLLRTLEGGA